MTYLLAFAYWIVVFVAVGAVLWGYVTVTSLLNMSPLAQGLVGFLILCGVLAIATVRDWTKKP